MPDAILDLRNVAIECGRWEQPQYTKTVLCCGMGKRVVVKEGETLNK